MAAGCVLDFEATTRSLGQVFHMHMRVYTNWTHIKRDTHSHPGQSDGGGGGEEEKWPYLDELRSQVDGA